MQSGESCWGRRQSLKETVTQEGIRQSDRKVVVSPQLPNKEGDWSLTDRSD